MALVVTGATASGLIAGHAAAWAVLIVGAVQTAGVFGTPNAPRPPTGEPEP